ncbi:hypothetical protein [Sphaerisporangium aureirubrum]|uniref:Uncharacterized protein n=1 Tax=Sphaerisporangium aureirubrum TaxID=1544736 RepID=A0ABW1NHJ9_9ACTN
MFAAVFILLAMVVTVVLFEITVNNRPRRRRPPSGTGVRPEAVLPEPAEAR